VASGDGVFPAGTGEAVAGAAGSDARGIDGGWLRASAFAGLEAGFFGTGSAVRGSFRTGPSLKVMATVPIRTEIAKRISHRVNEVVVLIRA
jgi:hypothetical protein